MGRCPRAEGRKGTGQQSRTIKERGGEGARGRGRAPVDKGDGKVLPGDELPVVKGVRPPDLPRCLVNWELGTRVGNSPELVVTPVGRKAPSATSGGMSTAERSRLWLKEKAPGAGSNAASDCGGK